MNFIERLEPRRLLSGSDGSQTNPQLVERNQPQLSEIYAMILNSIDIGITTPPGSTSAVGSDGFDVAGAGANVWGNADQFRFVYKQATGDFDVKARIAGVGEPAGVDALVGLMARATLDAGAVNAFARTYGNSGEPYKFGVRSIASSSTTSMASGETNSYPNSWVRLSRAGNQFTAYSSRDGASWTRLGTAALSMPQTIFVGLAVCSRTPGQLATAQFRDFSFPEAQPAPQLFALPIPLIGDPALPALPLITREIALPLDAFISGFVAQANTRYKLDGRYIIPQNGLRIDASDVEFALSPTSELVWNTTDRQQRALRLSGSYARRWIHGGQLTVNYAGANNTYLSAVFCAASGTDIIFSDLKCVGGQLAHLTDCDRVLFQDWTSPVLPEYGLSSWFGGRGVNNVTLNRVIIAGSISAHAIRVWAIRHMLVLNSAISNPDAIVRPVGVVKGEALDYMDGFDFIVRDSIIDGPCRYGPLQQKSNATYRVNGVTVLNTKFLSGYTLLEAGLSNLLISGCNIHSTGSGSCFSVHPSIDGKSVAQGQVDNDTCSYLSAVGNTGTLFSGNNRGVINVGSGVTFNGKIAA